MRLAILAALCAALAIFSAAADPVETESGASNWNLSLHADYLREGDRELTVDDVSASDMAQDFKSVGSESVNFGIQRGAYWLRVAVSNPRPKRETFYVVVGSERLKRVDFYAPGLSNSEAHQVAGTEIPFAERSMPYRRPVFALTLDPGQEETVYVRVYHRGSLRFPFTLWEYRPFIAEHTLWDGLYGMFYGSLFIMFVFNLVLAALFRERVYLLLAVVTVSLGAYMAAYQRLDTQYLWPHSPDITGFRLDFFMGLGLSAVFLFSRDFLGMAQYAPRWDRIYRVFAVVSLTLCLGVIFQSTWNVWLLQILGIVGPAVLFAGTAVMLQKGDRYAWGYLITWGAMFLAMIPFALQSTGLIPQNTLVEEGPKIAFPLALCLNSIGIWLRFQDLQRAYAANLARQVKERTRELEEALAQVKTLTGLLPICSHCKKIRDDSGYWSSVERYVEEHTDANFTHGICPDCGREIYGEVFE